ncbi:MAG: hypothetical protein WBD36_13230 [Bacteroidota bacterium]
MEELVTLRVFHHTPNPSTMNRRTFLRNVSAIPLSAPLLGNALVELAKDARISASMWTYLWDLVDEGYGPALARMKENGLTAVSLATAYHAGKFLLPHNPKEKVYFPEDGTVYFDPDPALYRRITPFVNSLVTQGHGLTSVRKAAERADMRTNAWIVCCHNTPLGTKYPDIACETAFGDKVRHNLCPSNADVRHYLRALVRDVANHGVERIELEALQFQGYTHGYHHEREGIPLGGMMTFLLGLCFCPSCMKNAVTAKVNINRVRDFVRTTLEAHFEDPGTMSEQYKSLDDLPPEIFQPFLEWRVSVVASLAREILESTDRTGVHVRPLVSIDPVARVMVGVNPGKIASTTGGFLVPGYVKDGDALREPLRALQAQAGAGEVIVGLQVGLPGSGGETEFLSRLQAARDLGVRNFNFYNYGFIPLKNLAWIKRGLG